MEEVVAAEVADLDEIMNIFSDARAFMGAQGNPQWQDGYPFRGDIEERIAGGHMYKLVRGREIVAVFSVCSEDADYLASDCRWLTAEGEYLAVHTVAVRYRGCGLARAIFRAAEGMARSLSKRSVRFDTHEANKPMRGLAEREGFAFCGQLLIRGNRKRLAYEKLI